MRSKGLAYSLPLEEILNIELSILTQPKNFQLLLKFYSLLDLFSSYSNQISNESELYNIMKNITIIYNQLRFNMNDTMTFKYDLNPSPSNPSITSTATSSTSSTTTSSSTSSTIKLNGFRTRVRSFGLILSSLYLPQLFDWIISDIFQNTSSRLLIVQSEYMFKNRLSFFQNELFNFLHPTKKILLPNSWINLINLTNNYENVNLQSFYNYNQNSYNYNHNNNNQNEQTYFDVSSFLSLTQNFKKKILHDDNVNSNQQNEISSTLNKIKPISNQKTSKLSESKISNEMKIKLSNFLSGKLFFCYNNDDNDNSNVDCNKKISYIKIFQIIEKMKLGKYIFKPSLSNEWIEW